MNLFVTIASISGQRKLWLSRSSLSASTRAYQRVFGWRKSSLDICCSSVTRVAARRSETNPNTTFPRWTVHRTRTGAEFVLSRRVLAQRLLSLVQLVSCGSTQLKIFPKTTAELRSALNVRGSSKALYSMSSMSRWRHSLLFRKIFRPLSNIWRSLAGSLKSVKITSATLKSNKLKTKFLSFASYLLSACYHLYISHSWYIWGTKSKFHKTLKIYENFP